MTLRTSDMTLRYDPPDLRYDPPRLVPRWSSDPHIQYLRYPMPRIRHYLVFY